MLQEKMHSLSMLLYAQCMYITCLLIVRWEFQGYAV